MKIVLNDFRKGAGKNQNRTVADTVCQKQGKGNEPPGEETGGHARRAHLPDQKEKVVVSAPAMGKAQKVDITEEITVHAVPVPDAETWLGEQASLGKAIDIKVYAGLYVARNLSP